LESRDSDHGGSTLSGKEELTLNSDYNPAAILQNPLDPAWMNSQMVVVPEQISSK
jgi:hypothetical protein